MLKPAPVLICVVFSWKFAVFSVALRATKAGKFVFLPFLFPSFSGCKASHTGYYNKQITPGYILPGFDHKLAPGKYIK